METSDVGRYFYDQARIHSYIRNIRGIESESKNPAFEEVCNSHMKLFLDLDKISLLKLPYKAFESKLSEKWKKKNRGN